MKTILHDGIGSNIIFNNDGTGEWSGFKGTRVNLDKKVFYWKIIESGEDESSGIYMDPKNVFTSKYLKIKINYENSSEIIKAYVTNEKLVLTRYLSDTEIQLLNCWIFHRK